MKKLLFLLLLPLGLFGQDYIPFPLENTRWSNGFYQCNEFYMDCWFYGTDQFYTSDDTLINGHSMTKILTDDKPSWFWNDQLPPTNYIGALREDSTKVYFVPWYLEEEVLLFDFSVEEGDTVEVFSGGSLWSFQVGDSWYEMFNGAMRKVINVGFANWIEGIGSDRGMFWPLEGNFSGQILRQECVVVNGEVIFNHEQGDYNCSLLSAENEELEISLYPNPNEGSFQIEGLVEDVRVQLLDMSGRLIGESLIAYGNGEVDFRSIPLDTGFYLVRINSENFSTTRRILIE